MTTAQALAPHLRARRAKIFAGFEKPRQLDRNLRARLMTRGRALMRRIKKRKHYGAITAKDYAVLGALLFQFANWTTGFCFPSYETIAEVAGCSRSHVAVAIKRLEAAGLLTWVNRLKWVKERCVDLFGRDGLQKRALRTSNSYRFFDPGETAILQFSSKSKIQTRTANQDSLPEMKRPTTPQIAPSTKLEASLRRCFDILNRKSGDRA